jgi:hypothetical protein
LIGKTIVMTIGRYLKIKGIVGREKWDI